MDNEDEVILALLRRGVSEICAPDSRPSSEKPSIMARSETTGLSQPMDLEAGDLYRPSDLGTALGGSVDVGPALPEAAVTAAKPRPEKRARRVPRKGNPPCGPLLPAGEMASTRPSESMIEAFERPPHHATRGSIGAGACGVNAVQSSDTGRRKIEGSSDRKGAQGADRGPSTDAEPVEIAKLRPTAVRRSSLTSRAAMTSQPSLFADTPARSHCQQSAAEGSPVAESRSSRATGPGWKSEHARPSEIQSQSARSPTDDVAAGHRLRLRARFDRGERLADYELLELLLFRSVPRRDTKPIARALMKAFGSFAAAIAAPTSQLVKVNGVGEKVASDFRLVRAAAERFSYASLEERKTLSSTDAVAEYYRPQLRLAKREEFHILFLDRRNQFLRSECVQVGTIDHAPVYPREVLEKCLEVGASAIVLVHNHPSGDPTPSRADITMTRSILEALQPVNIAVHDHLIIGGDRYTSLRQEGVIE
ncbi:DNA repair protein RadC [Acuticoccus sp. M5D2P5]|uniref:RadC family protein n=1 Tax=Acuticoccus kalidii TaxID=2910977 RepID=UPI001F28E174|nr:DNA repair protein RadC [Acuticoccus kalidii]MCF3931818.1 DNA repair protein RadC [Acuticoccus kalidii]